jgi:hypothetical protein
VRAERGETKAIVQGGAERARRAWRDESERAMRGGACVPSVTRRKRTCYARRSVRAERGETKAIVRDRVACVPSVTRRKRTCGATYLGYGPSLGTVAPRAQP